MIPLRTSATTLSQKIGLTSSKSYLPNVHMIAHRLSHYTPQTWNDIDDSRGKTRLDDKYGKAKRSERGEFRGL